MGRWSGRGSPPSAPILVGMVAGILLLTLAPPASLWTSLTTSTASANSTGPLVVAPAFVPSAGVRDLGPQPSSTPLELVVGLGSPQADPLAAETALEYTPGSPEYHQFLSVGEIAARYGAPDATLRAATAYFEQHGLTVVVSPDRFLLRVSGPSSSVAAAFHTGFEQYRSGNQLFFSHPTDATLPSSIGWYGVLGLGNQTPIRPLVRSVPGVVPHPSAACVGAGFLIPCQIYRAYNGTALINGGTNGTGFRVGVVDTYDGTQPQPTLAADLKDFAQNYSLPYGPVKFLYPVPTPRNLNATSTSWGLEESLDLEWSRAMAPGATIDMTFAPDATTGLYAAVDWLVAHHAVDVISMSWGEPDTGIYNRYAGPCPNQCNASSDGSYNLLHPVLEAAIAEGIGVFSASGDCGAAYGTSGDATGYPSSDPAVVGVGGTDLTLTSNGSYSSETAWSGNSSGAASPGCQNQGGSGGGFSPFPRPFWQQAPGVAANQSSRGVPDVSIVGGTPVSIVYSQGLSGVEGTSESTPMWAGIEAIADQAHGFALGDLNPSLYTLARGANPGRFFHDVTSGSNGYAAGGGWDPVTGLGTPNLGALIPALGPGAATSSGTQVTLHATPRLVPLRAPVTFYLNTSNETSGLAFYDVSFGDGNASVTSSNNTTHAFTAPGVYIARATAFDRAGNSSTSPPVAVVAGGGGAINVTLTVSNATPATGSAVGFTVIVRNGLAPFTYTYDFGDGTYYPNATSASTAHAYGAVGAFCAAVVVHDARAPPDGGTSNRVAVAVGGAGVIACDAPTPLSAQLIAPVPAADLPGDLPLSVMTTGGTAPFSVRYVTDDPYVNACGCGIFSRAGNHTLTAFVNDSLNEQTVTQVNVTLYPALTGHLAASPTTGPAPLTVVFSARVAGGHGADAARTNWSFGDGTYRIGSSVAHTYLAPGLYVAVGSVGDLGFGNLSSAYVIDVLGGVTGGLVVTANVTPAVRSAAGTSVTFNATATGGIAPYTYVWSLGDGDSAFGNSVTQTYSAAGCLGLGTCPLTISLNVSDATGRATNLTIPLAPAQARRASGLTFTDQVGPGSGSTPLVVNGTASVTGFTGWSLLWNFGDGGSAGGTSVSHRYLLPGNFTITEIVSDAVGDRLVRSHIERVSGVPRTVPSVGGGPSHLAGIVPYNAAFHVTASGGAGGPYNVTWNFGDGTSGNGTNTTHLYTTAGNYSALATATDRLGDPGTATYAVQVYNVTWVIVNVAGVVTPVAPGVVLSISAHGAVRCTSLSVPGCRLANATFQVAFLPTGGGGTSGLPVNGNRTFDAQGWNNFTVPAPTTGGSYDFALTFVNPAYVGGSTTPINVTSPAKSSGAFHVLANVPPVGVLVAAATLGAAVALIAHRRRSGGPESAPS